MTKVKVMTIWIITIQQGKCELRMPRIDHRNYRFGRVLDQSLGTLAEGDVETDDQCLGLLYYFDQVFTHLEKFGQKKFKRNRIIQKKNILGEQFFWL
jgi:hypothetical protein